MPGGRFSQETCPEHKCAKLECAHLHEPDRPVKDGKPVDPQNPPKPPNQKE